MAEDTRNIRLGVPSQARNATMPGSPDNRYASTGQSDVSRFVPIGSEFNAETSNRAARNLTEGLSLIGKAKAEVETVNDSIMSRRMQAELTNASAKIISSLSTDPEYMNKPSMWTQVYQERMALAQEDINTRFDGAFLVGKNRLLTDEALNQIKAKEAVQVARTAALRVSQMAADETNAAIDIAIKSGQFDEASRITEETPYLSDAQKMKLNFTIDQARTTDEVQQMALTNPYGLLEEIQTKGSVRGRALSYEQQQYGINQARSFINEDQKKNYNSLVEQFMLAPEGFSIEQAKQSLEVNGINTQQFATLWRMYKQNTANIPPTSAEFARASKYAASMIPSYQNATPEQRANLENQLRTTLKQANFSSNDQTSLINLMKTHTPPSYLDDAKTWVERVWDTGKYPLYTGKDYVDKNGTPIYMTEAEFNNSFVGKNKQYYLDKTESRAYEDPETLAKRYVVREKIPNLQNDASFKNFIGQVRAQATQQVYDFMGQNGGKTPTEQERYKILADTISQVSKESGIPTRGFTSYFSAFQQEEDVVGPMQSATRVIALDQNFTLGDKTELPEMPNGGFVVTLGTPNSSIYEVSSSSGEPIKTPLLSKDMYKSSGGSRKLLEIGQFYLQKPSADAMDNEAERRARILRVNNGLSDEDEQAIYSALISYWNR